VQDVRWWLAGGRMRCRVCGAEGPWELLWIERKPPAMEDVEIALCHRKKCADIFNGGDIEMATIQFDTVHGLTDGRFKELVEKRAKLAAAEEKLKAAKETINGELQEYLTECGISSAVVPNVGTVTLSKGRTTKTIDAQKLIEHGVSSVVIQSCTVERTGEPFMVFHAAETV
jgi:hypothetical protein